MLEAAINPTVTYCCTEVHTYPRVLTYGIHLESPELHQLMTAKRDEETLLDTELSFGLSVDHNTDARLSYQVLNGREL